MRTELFFADIRQQLGRRLHSDITCISIRGEDKIRTQKDKLYNSWSLSLDYYRKALDILRQRNRSSIFLYLSEGGTDPQMVAEDRQWVKDTFITPQLGDRSLLEPKDFTAADSLHMMTECDSLVVSASSFSWWAGYLSKKARTIIAPRVIQEEFVPEDYYPPSWTLIYEE